MNRETKRAQQREERRTDQPAAALPDDVIVRERTSPGQYLKEVRSELRKVAWPNRREVVSYTIVVLVTTTVLTLLVFGMDWLIRNATLNLFG